MGQGIGGGPWPTRRELMACRYASAGPKCKTPQSTRSLLYKALQKTPLKKCTPRTSLREVQEHSTSQVDLLALLRILRFYY